VFDSEQVVGAMVVKGIAGFGGIENDLKSGSFCRTLSVGSWGMIILVREEDEEKAPEFDCGIAAGGTCG